ncbi:TRAFAC clade GTPase domain-containing protein [Stenotrophomonas maltophilia]
MDDCPLATCFVPDTGCDLGHTDLSKCPRWHGAKADAATDTNPSGEMLMPWSGSAFGLSDLGFVSGRAKPIVIGVVGPQNAGKTTLLAAWYLLLGRGLVGIQDQLFAGSYTLSGWEAVAGSMRWAPGQPPRFPAHTTSRVGRAPGLLHLTFREKSGGHPVDYLFTDAPGEWFQRWAINTDSDEGAGARWVSDNADAFMIVADREALAGESMGAARGALQRIAKRLGAERESRPVALVWTKADVDIRPEMEEGVRSAVLDAMPDVTEHSVSVIGAAEDDSLPNVGVGLVELFHWAINLRRPSIGLPPLASTSDDPLFIYGNRNL